MSEQAPHQEKHELSASPERSANKEQEAKNKSETTVESPKLNPEEFREKIEKKAESAKQIKVEIGDNEKHAEHYLVTKGLKEEAFKRNLQRARKHMSATSRGFSKLVHQPVVDAVSKVGEKTIARPTGILTGSIVALVGSSYLFYTAKHYGFQYNYLVVFILLGGGYLVGLVIELLIYGLRRARGNR